MTKLGVSTLFCLSQNFDSLTFILPQLGVKYVEVVDDGLHALNEKRVKVLKNLKTDYGLEFTVHAPFADINIGSPNSLLLRLMLKQLEKSIQHAKLLDSLLWIFHPGLKTGLTYFYPDLEWNVNRESVKKLLSLARKYEVKIGIENVPEPFPFLLKRVDDFTKFFSEFEEHVGLVFDVGHANINGQIKDFLLTFSRQIIHIHVSDNKGDMDAHLGIGHGVINWKEVAELIRQINYDGLIIIESVECVEESLQTLKHLFR